MKRRSRAEGRAERKCASSARQDPHYPTSTDQNGQERQGLEAALFADPMFRFDALPRYRVAR